MNSHLLQLKPAYLARVVAFGDALTLGGAGRICNCDEANIYRALARLEETLQCKIYKRGAGSGRPGAANLSGRRCGRPAELTARGLAIVAHCRDILAAYAALLELGGMADECFSTPAKRRAVLRRISDMAQPAAGASH